MAKISLQRLAHSYSPNPDPARPADWALKPMDLDWADGGAYALLGPSGCGKTSLLNIISGLIRPSRGEILFDGRPVTGEGPATRNIAQVFQFPVIYDTMTVRQNLAFPLRNRGVAPERIDARVREVAAMLDLTQTLDRRATNLTADGKQKISLGRGLVREDVHAILFDEPLTVIDPHLKWQLRSKLKELHQRLGVTMIYVTHDQTEALTFADRVVVMQDGVVVQSGTPVDLFERPRHVFVGHFIGSPGMNLLPAALDGDHARIGGIRVPLAGAVGPIPEGAVLELGIRPEFIGLAESAEAPGAVPARLMQVQEAGRYRILTTEGPAGRIRLLLPEGAALPTAEALHLRLDPARTNLYANSWIVTGGNA